MLTAAAERAAGATGAAIATAAAADAAPPIPREPATAPGDGAAGAGVTPDSEEHPA